MVPSSFQPATWRGTTAADASGLGISFDRSSGEVVRLHISLDCAKFLSDSIQEALGRHSARSSGSSSLEVSPQLAVNV